MKLQLAIYDIYDGGALISEEAFDVVSVGAPFSAPGLFGTNDPFKTVLYKDSAGITLSQYVSAGEGLINIYVDGLIKRYKLIN